MSDMIYAITLELSDGRKLTYAGKSEIRADDMVTGIVILEPMPMPPGCR